MVLAPQTRPLIDPSFNPDIDDFKFNFEFLISLPLLLLPIIFYSIYNLKVSISSKKMDNCPDQYFKFSKNKKFYVSPGRSNEWYLYSEWLNQTANERKNEMETLITRERKNIALNYCTKCGAKIEGSQKICGNCGAYLC